MLKLIDLSAGYHAAPVLKKISLEAEAGRITTLIGLNGSGKSTLLKTALGLIKPARGRVLLEGRDLASWSLNERAARLSLLESQPPVAFATSVAELLDLSARRHAPDDAETLKREALATVGLAGYDDRNLLELSSGERKRAMLAHSLCANARVIMLDEPLAHLDWKHQHDLAAGLLAWCRKYNTTFVLALHELEWAVKLSDRVCALHRGEVLAAGQPEEVLASDAVREVFAFRALIDENPIDGSMRLTLGHPGNFK